MDPILTELEQATGGLLLKSESDCPFEVIDLGMAQHPDPSPEQLLEMLERPTDEKAETVELSYFFRYMTHVRPEESPIAQQTARRFQVLEQILTTKLKHAKVIRLGTVEVEAFILGTTEQGRLVGLKTTLVET